MSPYRRQAGAGMPGAHRLGRPASTPQAHYWRRTSAVLAAGTGSVVVPASGTVTAITGPAGTGEQWQVDLVQVQTSSQYGTPPLVVQQIAAQATGKTLTPPPPVVAQVWRAVAGQAEHLLAQTTQGGNDDLGIACPVLSPGEQIMVVWYNAHPGNSAWAVIKGTKLVLSAT